MKFPKEANGYNAIAGLINKKFGPELGIECSKVTITRWRKCEQLPRDLNEPFPAPKESHRFDVDECFGWVKKYIAAKKLNPSKTVAELEAAAEAKARRERAKANREERLDRKEAGDVIERAVAEIDAIGIVQRLHNACTLQDEQEVPVFCITELKQLGVDREIVSVFAAKMIEKMRDITTRRVAMFQNSTEEFLKETNNKKTHDHTIVQ